MRTKDCPICGYTFDMCQMTREEAIYVLKEISTTLKSWSGFTEYPQAIDMAIETLQAEPVKHGEWECSQNKQYCIRADFKALVCSICGCNIPNVEQIPKNYCPNCGAKMKGQEE